MCCLSVQLSTSKPAQSEHIPLTTGTGSGCGTLAVLRLSTSSLCAEISVMPHCTRLTSLFLIRLYSLKVINVYYLCISFS